MILVRSSNYLSSLLFCIRDLSFLVWLCCFVKRRLFSPYKRHFTIVEKFPYFKTGQPRILVKSSKYLSIPLFCTRNLGFVVSSCCFVKRRLFSPSKRHFTIAKTLHIFKRVNPWFWSEVPHIFRAHFSVKETLVLSFINVVLWKGSFLVHKNAVLL